jgi:phosphoglycerate dehydrogenase-like enzyme
MGGAIACLDFPLAELIDWVKTHARPGFDVRFPTLPDAHASDGLLDVEYLLVFESRVDDALLRNAPRLRLIQLPQVGFDNIDVGAAKRRGIPVCNTPGINAASVAEHALMLTLAVVRRLRESDSAVRRSAWPQVPLFEKGIHDLAGQTVGMVGFGATGQAFGRLCRALGARVLYSRRTRLAPDAEAASGAVYTPLDVLLREAHVVSLHVPLNNETRGLIGRRELGLMRPGAVLINTSRGGVLDEAALVERLRAGALLGAGLDVLAHEPPSPDNPLLSFENVMLTPHVASSSKETAWRALDQALANVYRVAAGDAPTGRVA